MYKWFKRFYRTKPKKVWLEGKDEFTTDFESELGRIENVEFQIINGYLMGLWLTLKFGGCGTCTDFSINMSEDCKWDNEAKRNAFAFELLKLINDMLLDAKVNSISDLKDKPIEVYSTGLMTRGFRILTEVL